MIIYYLMEDGLSSARSHPGQSCLATTLARERVIQEKVDTLS